MGKAAATKLKTTGTPRVDAELEQFAAATAAKQQFISSATSMSWRLAVTIVIPVVLGVKLDDHFHSSPSLTLTGFFIAVAAGASAVWSTVKAVNREQAAASQTDVKTKRSTRA